MLRRGDIVVLLLCAALLPWLFSRYGLPGTAGAQVRISSGLKVFAQAPLNRDALYRVPGALGISKYRENKHPLSQSRAGSRHLMSRNFQLVSITQ